MSKIMKIYLNTQIDKIELRIGNYMQWDGVILTVSELSDETLGLYVNDRTKFPLPDGWRAEKIPLTDKWLHDFGFTTLDCEIDYVEWGNVAPDVNGETFAIVQDGIGLQYPYFFDYSLDDRTTTTWITHRIRIYGKNDQKNTFAI